MEPSLKKYIAAAKEKDLTDQEIHASLVSAGWPEEVVTKALSANNKDLLVPPPPPHIVNNIGMWVGFTYIVFFISLYILLFSVGWLLHDWVETAMPNPSLYESYDSGDKSYIQGLIAAIVVAYPICMLLAIVLKRQLMTNPQVANLRSRKILIYFTLIITFLIMLGHIIGTVYEFLSGGFSSNAILHLLITASVAGPVFWYFITEVLHDRKTN